jgi:hypothetical protein
MAGRLSDYLAHLQARLCRVLLIPPAAMLLNPTPLSASFTAFVMSVDNRAICQRSFLKALSFGRKLKR